jgi:hypothetical protein
MAISVSQGGEILVQQSQGGSAALDLEARLHLATADTSFPPGPWAECFGSYTAFLDYCIPQGNALSVQSWDCRTTAQNFCLDGTMANSQPLLGEVDSQSLRGLCGDAKPICFLLPRVDFVLRGETTLFPGQVA